MAKKRLLWFFFVFCGIVLFSFAVFSQEDIRFVDDSGFAKNLRPLPIFNHDEHNYEAGIDDCITCHHVYENGKRSEWDSSEGMECSECHIPKNPDDPMELISAYHGQCRGCHLEKKKGPFLCGECHVKQPPK